MHKYQLQKLSGKHEGIQKQTIHLEDILTSDVFGFLSYVDYEYGLKKLLITLAKANMRRDLYIPMNKPSSIEFWKSIAWPSELPKFGRELIEPDVFIKWDDLTIAVEAKRNDVNKSDMNEFLREYLIAQYYAKDSRFYVVLVDACVAKPTGILNDIIAHISAKTKTAAAEVKDHILWCNWQRIYRVIAELEQHLCREGGLIDDKSLVYDLLKILERKELKPFEAVDINVVNLLRLRTEIVEHLFESVVSRVGKLRVNLETLSFVRSHAVDKIERITINLQRMYAIVSEN